MNLLLRTSLRLEKAESHGHTVPFTGRLLKDLVTPGRGAESEGYFVSTMCVSVRVCGVCVRVLACVCVFVCLTGRECVCLCVVL